MKIIAWGGEAAHLAHGLGVSDGGGEVAVVVQATKEAAPAVVPVRSVGQAPGYQWLTLRTQPHTCQSISTCFTCGAVPHAPSHLHLLSPLPWRSHICILSRLKFALLCLACSLPVLDLHRVQNRIHNMHQGEGTRRTL